MKVSIGLLLALLVAGHSCARRLPPAEVTVVSPTESTPRQASGASTAPTPRRTAGDDVTTTCPINMVRFPATEANSVDGSTSLAAFCLDVTEVTVPAYTDCVYAGRCTPPSGTTPDCNYGKADKADFPINCVRRAQAVDYCAFVGKRLPSLDELGNVENNARAAVFHGKELPWDAVCENSQPGAFPAGSNPPDSARTCPVRSGPQTPEGLYGIFGNVWEWTTGEQKEPDGYVSFAFLVGGSAKYSMGDIWPAEYARHPDSDRGDIGLRCAK
jgi:formylglycine-generating enzyme required for sulfatase activity